MRHTILVPVEVEVNGYDGKRTIPAFWSEVATLNNGPFDTIGRSEVNPFVFYLTAEEEEKNGPNGGFLAVLSVKSAFESIAEQFAGLVERVAAEAGTQENTTDDEQDSQYDQRADSGAGPAPA